MKSLATETIRPTKRGKQAIALVSESQISDRGVCYSGRRALSYIKGTPGVGQYSVREDVGCYVFAATDATKPMRISYQYESQDGDGLKLMALGHRNPMEAA